MRVDSNHPLSKRATVKLNGRQVHNALEADDVAGRVVTSGAPAYERTWYQDRGIKIWQELSSETHAGTVRLMFNPPLTAEERERYGDPAE